MVKKVQIHTHLALESHRTLTNIGSSTDLNANCDFTKQIVYLYILITVFGLTTWRNKYKWGFHC